MRNKELEEYFIWMRNIVIDQKYSRFQYGKLFGYLFDKPFISYMPHDENRISDGIDLRYRYAAEVGMPLIVAASQLDDRDCSVLEMMLALAIRCEETIMDNEDYGDRTGQWFWNMMVSLGLEHLDDWNFNEKEAEDITERFIRREYEPNGNGGLFTIPDCRYDLTTVEIWYQMNWYLNTL